MSTNQQNFVTGESKSPTPSSVRTATIDEQKYIIATMVLAFSSDPAIRWLYPDSHTYLGHFPDFVQAFAGKAFTLETVYQVNDYCGAALWLPPGIEPDVESIVKIFEQTVCESKQADLFAVFEQMEKYHPTQPHWYLPMIGVDPKEHRKGYGSRLMQHILQQCDRDRFSAYLESSKPENIPFYERHGFELLDQIQVGTSPPIFPMLRQPR